MFGAYMFSFPVHEYVFLVLSLRKSFEVPEKSYIVRLRQDTGISSPSLYPSPLVALVLPAVDPVGNSAPARNSRAIREGIGLDGRGAGMLASVWLLQCELAARGGEFMK